MTSRRGEIGLIATAAGISGCGLLPATLAGVLAVEVQKTIPLRAITLGLLLASAYLCAGLTGILGGRYCERVGWKRAGQTAAIASVASLTVLGLSQDVPTLAVALVLAGGAISVGTPAAILMLTTHISPGRRGPAFGLNSTAMPLVTLLAGLALPVAVGTVGWRVPFLAACLWPLATLIGSCAHAAAPHARIPRIDRVGPSRELRLATCGGGLGSFSIGAVTGFFVISAVASGMSSHAIAVSVVVGSIGGLVVRLLSVWGLEHLRYSGFTVSGWLLLVCSFGLAAVATQDGVLMAMAAVVVYTAGLGWQSTFYWAVSQTNIAAPASATGFSQLGIATGAALGPLTFGTFTTLSGATSAWLIVAGFTLTGGGLLLRAGASPIRRGRPPQAA
jgi:MFS family permease